MAGQEVIPEEEDMRLLELLRAQIKYRAARQYAHAAKQAAGGTDGAAFQDRAYQVMYPPPSQSVPSATLRPRPPTENAVGIV